MSLDGNVKLNRISFNQVKYIAGNRFTANKMWYFFKDNYIYFLNIGKMRTFRISAIFEDMIEAQTFSCEMNNCIDVRELEFKTDDTIIDKVITTSFNELINIFPKMREDLTNDSKDSIIQQSK